MLTANRANQQEGPSVVKVEPNLSRLRKVRIVLFVGYILWIVGVILSFIGSLVGHNGLFYSPLNIFSYIAFVFYSIFIIVMNITLMRFWKRLEERRQAAARGDQSLLAADQPVPNASALQLPITIGQRPKWTTFLLFPGIALMTMLILGFVFIAFLPHLLPSLPNHRPLPHSFIFIVVGIFVATTLLYCCLLFGILYAKVRQQVTVTEDGLIKVGLLHKVHNVSWKEARLFAINGIYGAKKYQYPSIFELSSANDIVRWGWMRRNTWRVMFFAKPTISSEEYDKQMQALLSLIAGRTGLPLYDLR